VIRPAGATDCAAIAAIWNHFIRDTPVTFTSAERTEAGLRALLAEKDAQGFGTFVAEMAGDVVGFATYGQFRAGPGYARTMEHTVLLAPDARGRGLGRGLLTAVEAHAAAAGAHSIFAGVSAANPEGRAFHAALGYREVAVLPQVGHKFGRWLDLVLMQKFLDPPQMPR